MSREPRTLRLFVSVEPTGEAGAALLGELRRRVDVSNARLVPAEQVHMTLHFIGETDVRDMVRVRESIERSVSGIGRFRLRAERLIQLPERGPPRLVATETDAPAPLLELQRRLVHRLARRPRRDAGDRFRPHLTLCRYRKGGRAERFGADAQEDRAGQRERAIALEGDYAWDIERVRLMASVLRPEGAEHRLERAFEL